MAAYDIRIFGDPVLKQQANEVTDIDGRLVQLIEGMTETLYEAAGLAVAAPQVGVQQRFFVYDLYDDEGPKVIINPVIVESDGEWSYEEGCLSIPGLSFEVVRPKRVHIRGLDIDGNELDYEADELEARMYQHEIDHLDGLLMFDRMDPDTRKTAMRTVRELMLEGEWGRPAPKKRRRTPEL